MERFTIVKETWSTVMDSERRNELIQLCHENAASGYQTAKAFISTLLGKLRVFLDASVLGHAFANYETLRLFGVSLIFALGISWMVGASDELVKEKRRKSRSQPKTEKVAKKQTARKLTFNPIKSTAGTQEVTATGPKLRTPHLAVIACSAIATVALLAARGIVGSAQKKTSPTANKKK